MIIEAKGEQDPVKENVLVAHIGNLHSQGSARHYVRAFACLVLLALLMTGCGGATSPEKVEDKPPPGVGDETPIGQLLNTLDETLVKVQGRQASFAEAGNTRGARLMGEAADNVRAMKAAARASGDEAFASASASPGATTEETTLTPEQRDALDRLLENRRQLEENIEEAKRCCGLPPDFLNEELREVDADVKSLRTQLGLEQDELEEATQETSGQNGPEETVEQLTPSATSTATNTSTATSTATSTSGY